MHFALPEPYAKERILQWEAHDATFGGEVAWQLRSHDESQRSETATVVDGLCGQRSRGGVREEA